MSLSNTPDEYLAQLPPERREAMDLLRKVINSNLPYGFAEAMSYGMIGWVVPHSVYPAGYHCNPKEPLPFMSIASQKSHIAIYHMGLYTMPELSGWFVAEYQNLMQKKPDMAKSCVRFKMATPIPYDLIAELVKKVSVNEWVALYEREIKR